MEVYLIKDHFRIDGLTGEVIEKEFSGDCVKHGKSIVLESARNEYVSFQVVFDTKGQKISKVNIDYSDLRGVGTISRNEYETYIEWFHKVNGKYIPDALIPYGKTNLEFKVPLDEEYLRNQRVGALWVDLFIPEETQPGYYGGKIKVDVDGTTHEFEITVKVHDVALCNESRIYADLNAYADSISAVFPRVAENPDRYNDGSYFELERQFHRMAYEHRCIFHYLPYRHSGIVVDSYAPEIEGEGLDIRVRSWERFDRHFGPLLDGTAFEGTRRGPAPIKFLYLPFNFCWPADFTKWGKKGYRTEFRRIMKEFTRHFEEKGWTETYMELFFNHKKRYRFFPFDGDETRFQEDGVIFEIFHDYVKDIFDETDAKFIMRTDSSWSYGLHYRQKYADICRLWVVNSLIFSWFPESVRPMKEKGNIVFIYGGSGGLPASLLELFVWPMKAVVYGIDGFTLWNSTGFGKADYLETPFALGSEIYWYPGVRFGLNGPIPSIRLKALRNFMQTGDLMKMAEGTGKLDKIIDVINEHFHADENFWWREKPAFINDPPHTWTNAGLSDAAAGYREPVESPAKTEKIKIETLKIMDGGEGK